MSVSEFAIYENELVINRSPTKFESNRELRKAVLLYKNERAKLNVDDLRGADENLRKIHG